MEFAPFTQNLTLEIFNKCRKDDLLRIADLFCVVVSSNAPKHMLKAELHNRLVDMQILPLGSGVKEGAVASVVAGVEATSDMSPLAAMIPGWQSG